ncbi:MAG: beta-ketoacyl-ACP synthase [Candidatus Scalindua sp.]|nr:beta-ketoacyl-ACP synthase [Candidatus Scalindua sp.]MCR4344659.1 beta-ketoacyl-ACP synthase [Candidatus Scalindua sp.]
MKRVVITGRGVVSALGSDLSSLMEGLSEGKSSVKAMPDWEGYKGLRSLLGAPAELQNEKEIPRKARRSMGRLSLFGVKAAEQAIRDGKVDENLLTSNRFGCVMGSTMGGAGDFLEAFSTILRNYDISELSSMSFFKCLSHTVTMNVAQYLGIKGYVMAASAACASSLQALGLGYELIRSGRQDVLLCGGAEELHPIVTGTFDILYATSTHYNETPSLSPRPFDKKRDGLVCGEGAGVLLLEEYEHAINRGAPIYGEVIGYSTCGSGTHVSQSSREGMRACMKDALKDAQLNPEDVDYVSAHATATLQGDQAEAAAIGDVFGGQVPVSSLKGYIGHTLGASGAIELAASLEMIAQSIIYPTLNLYDIDPQCNQITHVMKPLKKDIRVVVKNCFAFGGINAALIVRKLNN